MSPKAKIFLEHLKESKLRGAASLSCGLHKEAAEELVKLRLAEKYGFGYRITEKGMKEL